MDNIRENSKIEVLDRIAGWFLGSPDKLRTTETDSEWEKCRLDQKASMVAEFTSLEGDVPDNYLAVLTNGVDSDEDDYFDYVGIRENEVVIQIQQLLGIEKDAFSHGVDLSESDNHIKRKIAIANCYERLGFAVQDLKLIIDTRDYDTQALLNRISSGMIKSDLEVMVDCRADVNGSSQIEVFLPAQKKSAMEGYLKRFAISQYKEVDVAPCIPGMKDHYDFKKSKQQYA